MPFNFQQKVKSRFKKDVPLPAQYSLSIAIFFLVAIAGSLLNDTIGYQGVGIIMLLVMSLLAMVFDILPVLLAAVLSALTWNYFFTPPVYEFNFENTEDFFLFIMYFFIAIVNAALSFRAKVRNRKMREKEAKEKAIALYNTILNSLSHELRTPIATIIGSIDALHEEHVALSANQKKELMTEVSTAALRLNQQVENLLSLSRLESGMIKLHLDWTDINELIHGVIQKLAPGTSHTITEKLADHLPLFKVDAVLIEQVLFNLLQNALLYTPAGTEIILESRYVNGNCQLIVQDNGPGFPESSIKTVFDKFNRIGHTNSKGTGLGLSIVKGFIEAHNGHVELSNNLQGGARFVIDIPAPTSVVQHLKYE